MTTTNSDTSITMTVGYIGLGNVGLSMAGNLPKNGYHLVVHDQDQAKVRRAVSEWENTIFGSSPAAFADCSVIITMLPHGGVVRDVLLGSSGIASSLKTNTIIVDTSSSPPLDTQFLGKDLAAHQLHLIDAPITQTYMHATDDGKSTLMVGSDSPEHYEILKPILQCTASYLFHMGPLGSGHAMKTLNNYVMASSICVLSDPLVTGQKFGLDAQTMLDVLNVGTGVNFATLDTFRRGCVDDEVPEWVWIGVVGEGFGDHGGVYAVL
jgi:3-hydroxyisobutyrate dehydrogenase-like beta-hydroxyacid dehydrogenase